MDVKQELRRLPDPDPAGEDRVWQRLQASRGARRRWPVGAAVLLSASALAALWWGSQPAAPRAQSFDVAAPTIATWSDGVRLEVNGQGEVRGTDGDLVVAWSTGAVRAWVEPDRGTRLRVQTEEAVVDVVGTVFTVTRDRLGAHTAVERGKVRVTCADGWTGEVGPDDGPRTCLPVRAALLLGRADALIDAGAAPALVKETLDRGLVLATDQAVEEELRVRRMSVHAELGDVDAALTDAREALGGQATRAAEIRRFAGRLALTAGGCAAALEFLDGPEALPEEQVLLAECLASIDPARAQALLEGARPSLDPAWADRAAAADRAIRR
jgi:ferric-dicitrate binding protein FerR (iron transport regulator)